MVVVVPVVAMVVEMWLVVEVVTVVLEATVCWCGSGGDSGGGGGRDWYTDGVGDWDVGRVGGVQGGVPFTLILVPGVLERYPAVPLISPYYYSPYLPLFRYFTL